MSKAFKCANCGGTFMISESWSEEKAQAEYMEQFGDLGECEPTVVCDDCYRKITASIARESVRPAYRLEGGHVLNKPRKVGPH